MTDLALVLADAVARGDFPVPAYPAAAMKLRRLLASDRSSATEVCEVVASDPALAATTLKLANSALYRPDGAPITTLGRAVHRVGMRALGAVAMASGVAGQALARGPLLDLKFAVWRRSVTAALICQKLATARGLDAEEAFLAGLLSGFGRTVATACLEKLSEGTMSARPLSVAEWFAVLDGQRARISQTVAERWELPAQLAAVIGGERAANPQLWALLTLSEQLCEAIDASTPLETLQLSPQDMSAMTTLSRGLPEAIASLMESPSMSGRPPPPPTAIAKPKSALRGDVRNATFNVADAGSQSAKKLHGVAISAEGLRLESQRPYQEATMAHLKLEQPGHVIDLWVSVVLCAPSTPNTFCVEAQLFAPSKELRADWLALWQRVA